MLRAKQGETCRMTVFVGLLWNYRSSVPNLQKASTTKKFGCENIKLISGLCWLNISNLDLPVVGWDLLDIRPWMLQCWCSCGFCKDPACLHPLRSWHQPGLYHVAPKNGAMNLYACISWYMIHDDIDWYQLIYVLYIHHRIIYIYNHIQITSCK